MDNFLEEIKQAEQVRFMKTTHEYVGRRKIDPTTHIDFKEFKPDIYLKIFTFCFAAGIFAVAIFKTFQSKSLTNSEIGGLFVAYIFSIFLGGYAVKQFFVDKTMNFKIRVDNSGISIDDTLYKWTNVYETAIMKKFAGKSSYKYLVVALNNRSTYECYDLTNFVNLNPLGFSMTLAKYIEYFKPLRH